MVAPDFSRLAKEAPPSPARTWKAGWSREHTRWSKYEEATLGTHSRLMWLPRQRWTTRKRTISTAEESQNWSTLHPIASHMCRYIRLEQPNRVWYFQTRFPKYRCLRCAHTGARPGLWHTICSSARMGSFPSHTARAFRLQWGALKGPICTSERTQDSCDYNWLHK
jgi:hypothetical protein